MPKPADWEKIKVRWEAGEDLALLSRATGRPKLVIEAEAKVRKWRNDKRPTLARTKPESEAKSARIVLTERVSTPTDRVSLDPSDEIDAAAAQAQHLADYQAVRSVAMQYLQTIGTFQDHVIPKVLTSVVGALKIVQDGQRKGFGLDRKSTDDTGTLEDAMAELDGRTQTNDP